MQEEEGNDWLFTVIAHIVNAHNLAIENMYSVIHSQDQFHLKKQLSDQPAKILLTEITDATCIIGKLTRYVMCSRVPPLILKLTVYIACLTLTPQNVIHICLEKINELMRLTEYETGFYAIVVLT